MSVVLNEEKLSTFQNYESAVRSYCRSWPTVFGRAKGYKLYDEDGREFIDFFAGAGALNYGHNHPKMQEEMVNYIKNDGIIHSLDMGTEKKRNFLERFQQIILKPRNLSYKIMFPGPTGTNAVESALKIARKVTGRKTVIHFTNAFHGMTIGSLSVTGNSMKRQGAGVPLHYTVTMPYDNYFPGANTAEYLEQFLEDRGSGVDLPAAVILETVQGEGGLQAARNEWLRKIADICKRWDMLLIIDDVQAGCGRTGTFFSFEQAKIEPDIVCLSKSISGSGLPMALTLIKPEHDRWQPGEHNGTFRGNNLAFITAAVALEYWKTEQFSMEIREKAALVTKRIADILDKYPQLQGEARGRGLMQGIAIPEEGLAQKISKQAFRCGLILETSGPKDEVLKFLPPLIIDNEGLHEGLDIVEQCMKFVLSK